MTSLSTGTVSSGVDYSDCPPYYLGADERFTKKCRKEFVVVTDSPSGGACVYRMFASFDTAEEWTVYLKDIDDIKNTIREINEKHNDNTEREQVAAYEQEMKDVWVTLVRAFIAKYTLSMVPLDIRDAIDDVFEELELETHEWPRPRAVLSINGVLCLCSKSD